MKVDWQGAVTSVQPRIRLLRSFDERSHVYLGYVLQIDGQIDGEEDTFLIAIGKAAQANHEYRVGDVVRGHSVPVQDERTETAPYYKTTGLKLLNRSDGRDWTPPPWQGVAPDLDVYRTRGHRRLSARTYADKCTSCQWGCRMAVEMTIDHWNPGPKRYRFETFCYGPKSCAFYKAGPTRKVPGRKGMSWEEEDWVDLDATSHRSDDE